MDRVADYRAVVDRLMREQERLTNRTPVPGVEVVSIADHERGQYLLKDVGWRDRKRVNDTYLHVRVKDGKVWVEEDGTEEGIANELVRAGVPKEDIVLAFLHPDERRFSDFAVA
jgi:hypothetical protein